MPDTTRQQPPLPALPVIHATAVTYLLDGGEHEVAELLITARLSATWKLNRADQSGWGALTDTYTLTFTLSGPRFVYDRVMDVDRFEDNTPYGRIRASLKAAVPAPWELEPLQARLEPIDLGDHWREELFDRARGLGVDNQAPPVEGQRVLTWNNLRFRSASETRIAEALDRAGALYWPNCRARLGEPNGRRNLEADFLVCWKGKYGILEVDGEPYHPPERKTAEQERDRHFHLAGVRVVQHYDANECFERPVDVVRSFLRILKDSA